MRFGAEVSKMVISAGDFARELGHSYVGSVHLLLALMAQPGGSGRLLRGAGLKPGMLRDMTMVFCGMGTPGLPLPQGLTKERSEEVV